MMLHVLLGHSERSSKPSTGQDPDQHPCFCLSRTDPSEARSALPNRFPKRDDRPPFPAVICQPPHTSSCSRRPAAKSNGSTTRDLHRTIDPANLRHSCRLPRPAFMSYAPSNSDPSPSLDIAPSANCQASSGLVFHKMWARPAGGLMRSRMKVRCEMTEIVVRGWWKRSAQSLASAILPRVASRVDPGGCARHGEFDLSCKPAPHKRQTMR